MAQSNYERVGRALELLNSGLKPFVEREMLAKYGPRWQYEAVKSLREQHLSGDEEGRSPVVIEPGLSAMPEMPVTSVTPVAPVPTTHALPYHRFHGSAKISALMMAGDAGKINEEVVKHLTMILGASVQVTLEIHADIPSGVPDETVRTVRENCRTLKFEDFGFEVE